MSASPRYGCYCPTCYQFVPDRDIRGIIEETKSDRTTDKWRAAFAEVYGVPLWMVKAWRLRPGISVLASQVMANMMRRNWAKTRGMGLKINALNRKLRH